MRKNEYRSSKIILFRGKPLTLAFYEHALNYGTQQIEEALEKNKLPIVVAAAPKHLTMLIDEYMKTGGNPDILKEIAFFLNEYPPFYGDMDLGEENTFIKQQIRSSLEDIKFCFALMTKANLNSEFAFAKLYRENARAHGEAIFAYLFFMNLVTLLRSRHALKGRFAPQLVKFSKSNFFEVNYNALVETKNPIVNPISSEKLFNEAFSTVSFPQDSFLIITGCIGFHHHEKITVTLGDDGSIITAGLVGKWTHTSGYSVFMPNDPEHNTDKSRKYVKERLHLHAKEAPIQFSCLTE